jgi:hypothetical protein
MLHTTRTLLSQIVDYAGLFPPAKLDMPAAVSNYAAYLAGPHAWMLGRFIVPVARLEEFEQHAAELFPEPLAARSADDEPPEPWHISAIVGEDPDADIERVFAFNQRHAPPETDTSTDDDETDAPALNAAATPPTPEHPQHNDSNTAPPAGEGLGGGAVIDTLEIKSTSGRDIDRLMTIVPQQLEAYFEIPTSTDPRGMIAAMAGTGARAKIRTGGVTPDAFPPAPHIARFIAACAAADVPFKATAGLHHPLRGEFNLTYEPGCARGTMYGFLNVFLAAALLRTGEGTEADAAELLTETNATNFRFVEQGIAWREKRLPAAKIALVRENFAMSFGSCSFDEPVNDLKTMGLLD